MDTETEWPCRHYGTPLHRAVNAAADVWGWADRGGRALGDDPDVARLEPDPYAYLTALGERITRLLSGPKARRDPAAAIALGGEYSSLKVRLDMGGAFHTHYPAADDPDTYTGPRPVPECCGMPVMLRPSGWHCRRTGLSMTIDTEMPR
jgi:hypothetical protein